MTQAHRRRLFASLAVGYLRPVDLHRQPSALAEYSPTHDVALSFRTCDTLPEQSARPLDGLAVFLTMPLDDCVRDALQVRIRQAGAVRVIATDRADGLIGAGSSSVVVCSDQSSPCYASARARGCVVANEHWLLDVLAAELRIDPTSNVQHGAWPVPSAALRALVRYSERC